MVHLLLANGADPNTDYIVTWEYGGETVYYHLSSAKNLRVDPLKWVDKYSQAALFRGSDTYLMLLDMYPDLYSLPVRSYSFQEAINRQRDTTNAMIHLTQRCIYPQAKEAWRKHLWMLYGKVI